MRAGVASRTARAVARALIYVGADPQTAPLLAPGAARLQARLLTALFPRFRQELRLYRLPLVRRLYDAAERRIAPGFALWIGLRKRWIADRLGAALAGGARQVLVVGAGLDIACVRIADYHPHVGFFEVDHPDTQALKRAALARLGDLPPNLRLVPLDVARSTLELALTCHPAYDRTRPTAVIVEGLLMYLTAAQVDELLSATRAVVGPGSRLLASFIEADADGQLALGGLERWINGPMRFLGEPFTWGVPKGELAKLLRRHDWQLETEVTVDAMRVAYMEPAGLVDRPVMGLERMLEAGG